MPGKQPDRAITAQAREVDDGTVMLRVGKKVAGRLLDGEMWDGVPLARAA